MLLKSDNRPTIIIYQYSFTTKLNSQKAPKPALIEVNDSYTVGER